MFEQQHRIATLFRENCLAANFILLALISQAIVARHPSVPQMLEAQWG